MAAHTFAHSNLRSDAEGTSERTNGTPLVSRVPRRSMCHVHDVTFCRTLTPSVFGSLVAPKPKPQTDYPRIGVARYPSSNLNCCHHVIAEYDAQLRELDLTSTRRVEIRQWFQGQAGDRLLFNYEVMLKAGHNCSPAVAEARAIVVDLKTGATDLLVERTADGGRLGKQRTDSTWRGSLSLPLMAAGRYELQTITLIDPNCIGAEAHLLIDSAMVVDVSGTELLRLVSLSCVGRVKP